MSETKRNDGRGGKFSGRSLAGACVLTAVLLVLTFLAVRGGSVFPASKPQKWYRADDLVQFLADHRLPAAVILSVLCGLWMLVRIPEGVLSKVYLAMCAVLVPPAAFLLTEAYNRGWWHVGASLSYEIAKPFSSLFLLNLLLYYLFFLALAFLLGSFARGYCTACAFLMAVGIVNYYVVQFRGSPIVPWDFLSLRTAGNVASNYEYTIHWQVLFASFGYAFLMVSAGKMEGRMRLWRVRIPAAAVALAALVMIVSGLQDDDVKDFWGIDTTLFTPNVRYTKNGFWPAFLANLSFLHVEKPDGYSPEKAEEAAGQAVLARQARDGGTSGAQGAGQASQQGTEMDPNIIVIMNEAFSDLSVLGDFSVSEDYMPNFRSLMEEYTSGYLLVSVKGGNTANTEYEFLSGDTMAFLPQGSVVFQQYLSDEVPTIAGYLKALGYETIGMHPYNGSGWERDRVYPLMGFDEFLDVKDFSGADKLRNYVSDKGAFDKIIETFGQKEPGQSQFIFQVTMQNHSGYTPKQTDNGFSEEIMLTDAPAQTSGVVAAERYLTLIKYSDQAFADLVSYFEHNTDEPTIIVMFGDHEPGDYITDVIDGLVSGASSGSAQDGSGETDGGKETDDVQESLEDVQKHYQVPFVIWNNFGAGKNEDIGLTSVNYLGAYILQEAGLPTSPYQDFLLQMQESLPAVAAGAYVGPDGSFRSWADADDDEEYGSLLNSYHILEYNHLIDKGGRVEDLYLEPAG